jgi:hypothetical protein
VSARRVALQKVTDEEAAKAAAAAAQAARKRKLEEDARAAQLAEEARAAKLLKQMQTSVDVDFLRTELLKARALRDAAAPRPPCNQQ